MLNYRLASGGCDYVNLKDLNIRSTSRWPKMLAELRHLRHLKIKRHGFLMPAEVLSYELQKLAPTLIELDLDAFQICEAFWLWQLPLSSAMPIFPPEKGEKDRKLWNIAHFFPKLESLTIGNDRTVNQPISLTYACEVLPPTITSLHLPHAETDHTDLASILPPQIQELEISKMSVISVLPPSLTSLSCKATLFYAANENFLKTLPHTYTGPLMIEFSPEIASLLPTHLEHLSISRKLYTELFTDISWPRALPHRLTKLTMSHLTDVNVPSLDATIISCLPRTITCLSHVELNFESLSLYAINEVQNREEKKNEGATNSEIANEISKNVDFEGSNFSTCREVLESQVWPPRLSTLILHRSYNNLPSVKLRDLRCLPSSLTTLESVLLGADSDASVVDLDAPKRCKFQFETLFPRLKRFKCTAMTEIEISDLELPDGVSNLHLRGKFTYNATETVKATFQRELEAIKARKEGMVLRPVSDYNNPEFDADYHTDEELMKWETDSEIENGDAEGEKGEKSEKKRNEKLKSKIWPSMPSKLRSLDIGLKDPQALVDLLRRGGLNEGLEKLSMKLQGSKSVEICAHWLKRLPSTLKYFKLMGVDVSLRSVNYLPRSLRTLSLEVSGPMCARDMVSISSHLPKLYEFISYSCKEDTPEIIAINTTTSNWWPTETIPAEYATAEMVKEALIRGITYPDPRVSGL